MEFNIYGVCTSFSIHANVQDYKQKWNMVTIVGGVGLKKGHSYVSFRGGACYYIWLNKENTFCLE